MNKEFEKYFDVEEIASKYVCEKMKKEEIYSLFDEKLKAVIMWLRIQIGRPIYANDWKWGGDFSQRGYRTNDDPVCKKQKFAPKSAHFEGKALDFDISGMRAETVREWIRQHKDEAPHPFRVEAGVNWLHIDVRGMVKGYEFNP